MPVLRNVVAGSVTLVCLGCANDIVAPLDPSTISFSVVRGNHQAGVVGVELPKPLIVRATYPNGSPAVGVAANWVVTSGGGQVYVATSNTDANGATENYWTLGTSTALPETVAVRAVLPNGEKRQLAAFAATATGGPA
ncbi:MAG TPA: hypothetical protein VGI83_00950, partial [Gemmatimonadales bacterium]